MQILLHFFLCHFLHAEQPCSHILRVGLCIKQGKSAISLPVRPAAPYRKAIKFSRHGHSLNVGIHIRFRVTNHPASQPFPRVPEDIV